MTIEIILLWWKTTKCIIKENTGAIQVASISKESVLKKTKKPHITNFGNQSYKWDIFVVREPFTNKKHRKFEQIYEPNILKTCHPHK